MPQDIPNVYLSKATMASQTTDLDSDNGNNLVLNIGIVGAGIAGLTTAAVLSRLGHNVEVSAFTHSYPVVGLLTLDQAV